jgi:hypothetical protein
MIIAMLLQREPKRKLSQKEINDYDRQFDLYDTLLKPEGDDKEYDIYEVLDNYKIPDGSIVAFDSHTGRWITVYDYNEIPRWADMTCEVYDQKLQDVHYV